MSLLSNVEMLFRRMILWAKAFFCWIGEAKNFLVCVGVLSVASVVAKKWPTESVISSIGLSLQLLGMGMALWLLRDLRKHFKQRPLWKLAVDWIRRFPRWNRHISEKFNGVSVAVSVRGFFDYRSVKDDPTLPYEERLQIIFRNIEFLREDQQNLAKYFEKNRSENIAEHTALKKSMESQKTEIVQKIKEENEELHTGSIIESVVGFVWIFIGVVVSTFSKELAEWLM